MTRDIDRNCVCGSHASGICDGHGYLVSPREETVGADGRAVRDEALLVGRLGEGIVV